MCTNRLQFIFSFSLASRRRSRKVYSVCKLYTNCTQGHSSSLVCILRSTLNCHKCPLCPNRKELTRAPHQQRSTSSCSGSDSNTQYSARLQALSRKTHLFRRFAIVEDDLNADSVEVVRLRKLVSASLVHAQIIEPKLSRALTLPNDSLHLSFVTTAQTSSLACNLTPGVCCVSDGPRALRTAST